MLAGGVGAYFGANSKPSLIAGVVSGLLIFAGTALGLSNPSRGFGLVGLTAAGLIVVFGKRYMDTHKVMPSLGLLGLSVLMLILLAVGHFTSSKPSSEAGTTPTVQP